MTDAEALAALYNNCDPATPALDKYYVDCTDVRGGAMFTVHLCTELSQSKARIHALFTGHVGCGKSSELKHLAEALSQKTPPSGQKRLFPVIVNMSEYLNEYDVSTADILLAVVAELAEALRVREGIVMAQSFLSRRWDELKGYLTSDIEINEGELSAPWGKVKVQRLRTDPTARERIREKVLPQTSNLLDEINLTFAAARTSLSNTKPRDGGEHYTDLVLILDNMERIQRLAGNEPGYQSQRALFIEGASQLNALDSHVVFTVPLALVRSDGGLLTQSYSKELFVLPMVKTEVRGQAHDPYPKGRHRLTELLARRVAPSFALTNFASSEVNAPRFMFENAALDFLIEYSAGHVRNLMIFAREATLYASGRLPISLLSVQRAIGQTASIMEPSLRPDDWVRLAELEVSELQKWDNNSPQERRLLENLCVMEYVNGGDENPLKKATPWYAVNPILRVQDAFVDAVEVQERKKAAAALSVK